MSFGRGDLTGNGGFDDISPNANSYQNYNHSSQADYTRLSQNIGNNIDKITQFVREIKRMIGQLGTHQDTPQLQERLHQRQHYTNQLSKETAQLLKDVKALPAADTNSEQRHRKTQTDRLMSDFSDVLNSFQTAQREAASTEKECVARARAASSNVQDRGGDFLVDLQGNLQEQQQASVTQEELQEIEERENAIRQLEADIVDVNMIFKDLGTMVHEQGEVIDSIAANVETAEENVTTGNVQLQQARAHQASARKKKLICAIIAVVILVIIIIIIVVETHK